MDLRENARPTIQWNEEMLKKKTATTASKQKKNKKNKTKTKIKKKQTQDHFALLSA